MMLSSMVIASIALDRRRWFLLAYLGILISLTLMSGPRVVGDGTEYLAVTENLSRLKSPALTSREARDHGLTSPNLVGSDGRQDVLHFWMYPLLVAAPAAAAGAIGIPLVWAFAAVNIALLGLAAWALIDRLGLTLTSVLVLGPIIWWVDKVHTEVFTFSLITLALCKYRTAPRLAIAVLGPAAAQNPPVIALAVLMAIHARSSGRLSFRALGLPLVAAVGVAAMHPIYYYSRIGRWTPLLETEAWLPGMKGWLYTLVDPNVGLLFHYPWLVLGICIAWYLRRKDGAQDGSSGLMILCALSWLLSFGQTWNFNHEGTPGMSRYALWLMPLTIPLFARVDTSRSAIARRVLQGTVACAVLWSLIYFRPSLGESHLDPTRIAEWQWNRYPALHDPLPEIFAERIRHQEMAHPLAATASCSKVLLFEGQWPGHCKPVPTPTACMTALCYANRSGHGYVFAVTSRRGGRPLRSLFD